MDFDLTEELQILRSTVRRFVDKELIPLELMICPNKFIPRATKSAIALERNGFATDMSEIITWSKLDLLAALA